MSCSAGTEIVNDGLVFHYDMGNVKSYPINAFSLSNKLGDWCGTNGRWTKDIDYTQIGPAGGYPLKMTVTSTDPYTPTYNNVIHNITEAVQGETWTSSVFVKSDVATTGTIFLFECNSAGKYTSISTNVTDIGTNWTRIYVTRTLTSSDTTHIQLRLDGPDNQIGVTLWWDGLMLERNSVMSHFSDLYNPNNKNIFDLTKNNTITANNLTYNSDGSFEFDGSNSNFGIDSTVGDTSVGSIEVIFKTSVDHRGAFIGWGDGGTSQWGEFSIGNNTSTYNDEYISYVNSNGTYNLVFYGRDASAGEYKLNDGNYHHAVVVIDGIENCFYVDGEKITPTFKYGTTNDQKFIDSTHTIVRIGNSTYNGGHVPFNGNIYSVKIYNRGLSTEEVKQNFNALKNRYGI